MLKIIQVEDHIDSNIRFTQRFEVFDGNDFRALLVFDPKSRQWEIDSSFTSDEMIEITDFITHINDQSHFDILPIDKSRGFWTQTKTA